MAAAGKAPDLHPGCKRRTTLIDTAGAAALTMSAADIAALDTALPHTAGLRYGSKAALEMIKPEVKDNKTIFLSPEDTARLIPTGGFSNEMAGVLNDTYNAFKRGK